MENTKYAKIILFLFVAMSLTSCVTIHKAKERIAERKKVKSRVTTDSTATTKSDSAVTTKTHLTNLTTTTSVIDTTVLVGADSSTNKTDIPDSGHVYTFTDGDITTQVSVDTFGKLTIKTKVKAKAIPVKNTTTTTSATTLDADTHTQAHASSTVAVKTTAAIDSTIRRKSALKSKEIKRPTGVVIFCIIFIILAAVIYIIVRARKRLP